MKRYEFGYYLTGFGFNAEDAWENAWENIGKVNKAPIPLLVEKEEEWGDEGFEEDATFALKVANAFLAAYYEWPTWVGYERKALVLRGADGDVDAVLEDYR